MKPKYSLNNQIDFVIKFSHFPNFLKIVEILKSRDKEGN